MNWKKFKNLTNYEKSDEANFILGIDIGNDSSCIAFYDKNRNTPEVIDISGGYGKPSIPTVVQYIPETNEWVFGEYAVLNKEIQKEFTITSIAERLGKREYIEIDKKPVSIVNILANFLKELLSTVKNINPNAEIVGIVASVPDYFSEQAKEEFMQAFQVAGYKKELIDFISNRECIIRRYYFNKEIAHEKILLLDFGSRAIRGGVYEVAPDGEKITINSVSSFFDNDIGTNKINKRITELFTSYYAYAYAKNSLQKIDKQTESLLESFTYQHKDLLFQKNISVKPVRLYFNFAYPPLQKSVTKSEVDEIVIPFKEKLVMFLDEVLNKQVQGSNFKALDVETIICTGGGFEMLWAKQLVKDYFRSKNVVFHKNNKAVLAEGAVIAACSILDVINMPAFETIDTHRVNMDIGIKVFKDKKEKFIPIIERNSFWWQKSKQQTVIINQRTDRPIDIELFMRNFDGDIKPINTVTLSGLPKKPMGTTKINIELGLKNFDSKTNNWELTATFSDAGFGELFPKTDFKQSFNIMFGKRSYR